MSILVIILVIALLAADSVICFVIDWVMSSVETVKKLKEKGWTIKPPEDGTI